MRRFLAIDHGGSKTNALVFGENGVCIASCDDRALFGCGERRKLEWYNRVERLLNSDPLRHLMDGVESVDLSLNGINNPKGHERAMRDAGVHLHIPNICILGDSMASLRVAELCGCYNAVKVVVCAGSGLNVSLKSAGSPGKSLGWRIAPRDQGGYGLGRRIWEAALDACNGLGEPTMLMHFLELHYRRESFASLVDDISDGEIEFAPETISPMAFKAAHLGDAVAIGMIDHLARRWAGYVDAIVRECCGGDQMPRIELYVSGGIFDDEYEMMIRALKNHVQELPYQIDVSSARVDPIVGCMLVRLDDIYGGNIPAEVVDRVIARCVGKCGSREGVASNGTE